MSAEEAKDAFNQNMMSGGLLADGPAEFGKQHSRKWLLTEYEAGDVVLHTAYTVREPECRLRLVLRRMVDTRINHQSRQE